MGELRNAVSSAQAAVSEADMAMHLGTTSPVRQALNDFDAVDTNRDGVISRAEFYAANPQITRSSSPARSFAASTPSYQEMHDAVSKAQAAVSDADMALQHRSHLASV